ncbi:uncharacterized protein LOC123004163 [Tribolium madens]|uniref:uncharacterized protein LOC123004163 n=1 Tax=Tribolium madens TaxID=41895 RepID=UPI001CF73395|nr:uncharacterized protein LOC123004163 [Tribolium madens]
MCQLIPVLLIVVIPIFGWDLSYYNISSDYFVSQVAVYGNRAFLSLPRSSCRNNITNPTLVEASWFNEQPIFPRKYPFFLDFQTWNNCDHLQDVVAVDMETMRPRLWVLDKGNLECLPKIVIYNIFQKINFTLEAPKNVSFNSLVVDGPKAYIGLDASSNLLIFSLAEFKWWQINLEAPNTNLPISTKYVALGRKEPILYLTGGDERGIFSLDLTEIESFNQEEEIFNANVTFLGEKLGNSTCLVADFKNGLSYYIPRDYVVVRWDTRNPPIAEHYNVLAQSYELLPYVSQLYTGPQNSIWALANPSPSHLCQESPQLSKRLIKLLKYNIFL